jgi:hypothetical protein
LRIQRIGHGAAQRRNCPSAGLKIVIGHHGLEVSSAFEEGFMRTTRDRSGQVLHNPHPEGLDADAGRTTHQTPRKLLILLVFLK